MPDQAQSATLAVAATFTAEPLLPGLALVLEEAGLNLVAQCAPYNQIFQELLTSSSLLAMNAGGANLLLIRLEDFLRDVGEPHDVSELVSRTRQELFDGLSKFSKRARSPCL